MMSKEEKLENSIRFLNEICLGWLNKIDLNTLDMTYNCILDQVFGYWEETMEEYNLDDDTYLFAGHKEMWVNKIIELRSL
jgi:hypothetical protein